MTLRKNEKRHKYNNEISAKVVLQLIFYLGLLIYWGLTLSMIQWFLADISVCL